jgi:hypothetical protein
VYQLQRENCLSKLNFLIGAFSLLMHLTVVSAKSRTKTFEKVVTAAPGTGLVEAGGQYGKFFIIPRILYFNTVSAAIRIS